MTTTVTLDYTGTRRWYRIPSSVTNVEVSYRLGGGGGGGGGADSHAGGDGGGASVAEGTLNLKGGDLIEVFVGEGGKRGRTTVGQGHTSPGLGGGSLAGYHGGRGGYAGWYPWSGGGGGGGGATVIRVNGNVVAVGGGGAGGAGGGCYSNGASAKNTEGAVNSGAEFLLPRQYLGYSWCSFLNTYGVWHADGGYDGTSEFYVYFPTTTDYRFEISTDDQGYITIDGDTIISHSWWGNTNVVTTTIGAGWRKLGFYAANSGGGPRAFAGRITDPSGKEIWTTRYSTRPAYTTNGLDGGDHPGDGGGGSGGGGGYQGGVGGSYGSGDVGGLAGTIGRAYGDVKRYGVYSNQRFSSWEYVTGDAGTGAAGGTDNATDGQSGRAVLTFKISNRDVWNKVGSSWKNTSRVYTKVDGVWRNVKDVYAKVNGEWKKTFTLGGEVVPNFASDSVDWNTDPVPTVAAPPVTISRSTYIAGIPSGGCGPAIAYGTLPTSGGTKVFAGRAPVLKNFVSYNGAAAPTKNIAFRGANVTDADLAKYGITSDFSEVSVVHAGQKLNWSFDVWVDHGWTLGFYHWNSSTIAGAPNSSANDYWDVFTADYGAGGRQHPVANGVFVIPSSFDANSVLICAFGDRRTGCPTGLHACYITVSTKQYN